MNIAFLDANVFLDAILKRTDNYKFCQSLFDESQSGLLKLTTTPSCLLNVIYFLQKAGIANPVIIQIIEDILKLVSLHAPGEATFLTALHAGFADLEDAVQYYTALQVKGIDYFITSNTKDYKKALSKLPVLSPKQFIALRNKK
jgi:predicted nucleic acid-binding protein